MVTKRLWLLSVGYKRGLLNVGIKRGLINVGINTEF